MSDVNKYKFICTEGKYLGVRSYYNYLINLYLHNDIFYEVWYFKPTKKIEKIKVLNDDKKLDLYIQHMNLLKAKDEK